ncbi:surfactin synthase thioesterase subunit [Ancylobacter aquaticus]|uniref:Surfactin synthase thioesterase subunit n=1 Tax=Ancylobacter aquaticus TaxID=100 RepID=A0A4R1HM37_ANCAQ|nr:thioesterase domain-containing protein [Ancylobacter aquaticus]TCK23537.1 surfactin synthase thioesterase subunit [Ancylobacter aquaticus]
MISLPSAVRAEPEAVSPALSPALLRWVRRPAGAPAIICLPHAGGSVLSCLGLAAVLPDDLAIATVALPGHAPDVPGAPEADVRRLAARLAGEIAAALDAELAPQGAGLTLLGNSFGALLAFETALALERADADCASRLHLVVSGFRSPSRPPSDAPLHLLPRAVLLAELRECFGAVGPDLGDLLGAREEAALRADLEACETYRLGAAPLLRCATSVIRLTADPSVSAQECAAWREVCAGPVQFRALDAGHFPWSGAAAPAFARLVGERVASEPAPAGRPAPCPPALFPPARES